MKKMLLLFMLLMCLMPLSAKYVGTYMGIGPGFTFSTENYIYGTEDSSGSTESYRTVYNRKSIPIRTQFDCIVSRNFGLTLGFNFDIFDSSFSRLGYILGVLYRIPATSMLDVNIKTGLLAYLTTRKGVTDSWGYNYKWTSSRFSPYIGIETDIRLYKSMYLVVGIEYAYKVYTRHETVKKYKNGSEYKNYEYDEMMSTVSHIIGGVGGHDINAYIMFSYLWTWR